MIKSGSICEYPSSDSHPESSTTNNSDYYTALQIYKITMILASCCLGLVLIMFLVCILKKTYCPSSRSNERDIIIDSLTGEARRRRGAARNRRASSMEISSIFNNDLLGSGVPFNCRPPYEKPPTYDESENIIRSLTGVPPPAYDDQVLEVIPSVDNSPEVACFPVSSSITIEMNQHQQCRPMTATLSPAALSPLTSVLSSSSTPVNNPTVASIIPPLSQREASVSSLRRSLSRSLSCRKKPTRNVPMVNINNIPSGRPRHPDPEGEEGATNNAFVQE
jgi:hypothetical protein